MENAVDALKMAGSVLLFVMALSICMVSFSQARESTDLILSYSDRESLYIEGDERFYYIGNTKDTKRYVGKETIIPTIYRAYKENYKIVFEFSDDYYLFEKKTKVGQPNEKVTKIDLQEQTIGSDQDSREFLNGIIYGKFENNVTSSNFCQKFSIESLNSVKLYEYLTNMEGNKKISESLGMYYLDDIGDSNDNSQSSVPLANRQEKRVITYTFSNQ